MSRFSDLLADIDLALSATSVVAIPLDRIDSDPDNPRKAFDRAALEALAASIAARGVLQPVTLSAQADGRYRIRFGDRRVRAARLAGLSSIPAIVSPGEGAVEGVVDQIIENDQREGLSAVEMGDAVGRLLAQGLSKAEISKRLGRSAADITIYAAIRDFPDMLQGAFLDGSPVRAAYDLYVAWKTWPGEVLAFVASHGTGVTAQAAAAFVRSLKVSPASMRVAAVQGGAALHAGRPDTDTDKKPLGRMMEPPRTTMLLSGMGAGKLATVTARWKGRAVTVALPAMVEITAGDGERRVVDLAELTFGVGERGDER